MAWTVRAVTRLLCFVISGTLSLLSANGDITDLYMAGFFPLENNNWDGSGLPLAAEMALDELNNRTDILTGYRLNMVWNDTMCDIGKGMAGLFNQVSSGPTKLMILGAGCSVVTLPMAETSRYWNLVQVSHTSSSPSLNNREKYPLLFRLYPSEESVNFPRLALMKQFGWKKAALLHSANGDFAEIVQHMRDLLLSNDLVPVLSESFSTDPTSALQNIKAKEARIIIANMFSSTARQVFCKAYNLGLTGSGYVWMIPGWFAQDWWKTNDTECSHDDMATAVQGYIAVESQAIDTRANVTDVGRTAMEFVRDYNVLMDGKSYGGQAVAPFAYDSVYTIALALNSSLSLLNESGLRLEDFNYGRKDIADIFFAMVNATKFTGITGPVRFDMNGKRLGHTKIEQLQGDVEITLGIYDDSAEKFVYMNSSLIRWSTDDGEPPPDGPIVIEEWRTLPRPLFIVMTSIAGTGIFYSIFLLVINIIYRKRRTMRLSSPNLNYVVCVGCFLLYVYVIIVGIDSTLINLASKPSKFFTAFCVGRTMPGNALQVKQWLLPVAFSLSFGATFAKAWRIHKIFANSKMKKRTIKDVHLLTIVGVLLVIDAILLVIWDTIDLPTGVTFNLTKEARGDVIYLPKIERCHCGREKVWTGVFIAYKGLMLLYGAFLAWENRVVKMDALSDARNIGVTIYTVVVLCAIVTPATIILKSEIDFAYGSLAASINFATTIMLTLCFLPKVHIIFTNSVSSENILINNMMSMSQRNSDARTEDRLIGDLKHKIKELETTNAKLKQSLRRHSSPVITSPNKKKGRQMSAIVERFHLNGQIALRDITDEGRTVISPEKEEVFGADYSNNINALEESGAGEGTR